MIKKTRVEVLFRPGCVPGHDQMGFVCHSAKLPNMIQDLLLQFRCHISEIHFSDVEES